MICLTFQLTDFQTIPLATSLRYISRSNTTLFIFQTQACLHCFIFSAVCKISEAIIQVSLNGRSVQKLETILSIELKRLLQTILWFIRRNERDVVNCYNFLWLEKSRRLMLCVAPSIRRNLAIL